MLPDSVFRQIVDFGSFMLILFISLYVPFIFCFNVDTPIGFTYFELFIDIWFIIEVQLNFFTGYYDKGVLVSDKCGIAKNYL